MFISIDSLIFSPILVLCSRAAGQQGSRAAGEQGSRGAGQQGQQGSRIAGAAGEQGSRAAGAVGEAGGPCRGHLATVRRCDVMRTRRVHGATVWQVTGQHSREDGQQQREGADSNAPSQPAMPQHSPCPPPPPPAPPPPPLTTHKTSSDLLNRVSRARRCVS